ncbi:MAG: hypothetical protein H7839_11255 [Magnetococcus sp. YQC-5]
MIPARIRHRLLEHNPLASVAAADPWENRLTDVESINQGIFDKVMRLLRQLGHAPKEPLAALVLGEVGNGKSHLIARLRLACQSQKFTYAFALVSPPEMGTDSYRYLLREIADSLHHPAGGLEKVSSWQYLAALIIVEGKFPNATHEEREQRLCKVLRDIQKENGKPSRSWKKVRNSLFLEQMPHLLSDLVELLVCWVTGRPAQRREAAAWLRGDVREREVLPARYDRSAMSRDALNDEARTILASLGMLLGRFHRPLLICFDRLEDLRHDSQHHAMDLMLTFLVDRMDAALPVAFVRGQIWVESCRHKWNGQTVGRMESNPFEMTGCSREEALELIRRRLESVLGQEGMNALAFDPATLLEQLSQGRNSPRMVITLANRRLQQILDLPPAQPMDPQTRLAAAWEQVIQKLQANLHLEPSRPERLAQLLRIYFFGDIPLLADQDYSQIEIEERSDQPALFWTVETVFHHQAVINRIKQALEWLDHHPGGKVIYVRDGRQPIPSPPKWPETNRWLQMLQKRQGRLLVLTPERVVRWHAIGELHDAIRAGDLTWVDETEQERFVPMTALMEFIRAKKETPFS